MPISRHRRHLIIAIDGPAGSGKSSTAKALAKRIKTPYIDTGAMYRALTLKAMRAGVLFKNKKGLVELIRKSKIELIGQDPFKQKVHLDGEDVTGEIREPSLTKNVFYVAQEPAIRREMVKKQRQMGQRKGAVMEGRDIGTQVFPDADFKFYFEANQTIRARRRYRELIALGQNISLTQVLIDQKKRDATDYNRKEGPLKAAKDALVIDTSSLTIDETVDKILAVIKSCRGRRKRLS
ncbi:MAG: cytidylate kinase [Candidatus Omnitrophica bacterium CG1_02_49_16]|nr:MAG: cytidylate kinase [Candidatus Omnitrophica bacterium CG1_02_49_16]